MRRSRQNIISACIMLFFVVCIIVPLTSVILRITPEGFQAVLHSPQFKPAVINSLSTALTATVISLSLSLLAAWSLERTQVRGKVIFGALFTLPMLIPSISHALGLVALFGKNGLLTNLFRLPGNIYGFWGIVSGSVMYSFPVAFLMFSNILRYEDGLPYQAAEVLGIPAVSQFTGLTLPYLKKTVISAFFAVFTMIITDYGVPLMIRGKCITLSVLMYDKAVSMMDYSSGSVIGALLLLPAVAAFLIDLFNPERGTDSYVSQPLRPKKQPLHNLFALMFCVLLALCVLAPIVSFCLMAFETKYPVKPAFSLAHAERTIGRGAGQYLINSILYAMLTSAAGTLLAFLCAYLTARGKGLFSKALHLAAITSMAIPGIVLGLSYVIFFHNTPIYGTILIVILANSVHFFSSPYLMMYNALEKLNPNLEAVGQCLGISQLHIIQDIVLPKVGATLTEMFTYFFVNSMMTISAVSFLAPPAPKPVALMIGQFESQLLIESAAFISLSILIVNMGIRGLAAVALGFCSCGLNQGAVCLLPKKHCS